MFSDSAHSTSLVTHKNDNQFDTCDVRVWLSVLSQCAVTTGPRAMCADANCHEQQQQQSKLTRRSDRGFSSGDLIKNQ